jgi:hypothetical protein
MPTVFNVAEIEALADRLYGRGVSKLLDDSPALAIDLRTPSRVLRALLSKIDGAAAKTKEAAELLAQLRVQVED